MINFHNLFNRAKTPEGQTAQPAKNEWEQMAEEVKEARELDELKQLDPENLNYSERKRVVNFAANMIEQEHGDYILPKRFEEMRGRVMLLDRKEYSDAADNIAAGSNKSEAFWMTMADALYYDKTDSVYIRIPANMEKLVSTTIHESMHFACGKSKGDKTRGFDEGATELYTRRMMKKAGVESDDGYYREEQEFVETLEQIVDPDTVQEAYFSGDMEMMSEAIQQLNAEFMVKDRFSLDDIMKLSEDYFASLDEVGAEEEQTAKHAALYSKLNQLRPKQA